MAKTVLVMRRGYTLVPADPWSHELFELYPEGKTLSLELKTSRSRGELNLYWAGLSLLTETMFSEEDDKRWPTTRVYHEAMRSIIAHRLQLPQTGRQHRAR